MSVLFFIFIMHARHQAFLSTESYVRRCDKAVHRYFIHYSLILRVETLERSFTMPQPAYAPTGQLYTTTSVDEVNKVLQVIIDNINKVDPERSHPALTEERNKIEKERKRNLTLSSSVLSNNLGDERIGDMLIDLECYIRKRSRRFQKAVTKAPGELDNLAAVLKVFNNEMVSKREELFKATLPSVVLEDLENLPEE
ncbi:hypothetical protein B0T20DRAFT_421135 [Sordaria brevicollis]|uniref:Uncharacterized protein n=1 Tax=Sordaria brevicollis TaxID=83679 RepID=A0AAE0P3A3_SORBR|nr:hypothetical protein B0T20DRAFT_421135 [Sordaria brevicollis]